MLSIRVQGCTRCTTVDGSEIRLSPVEVGSLSHHLQGFIHPRWLAGFLPSILWYTKESPTFSGFKNSASDTTSNSNS